MADNMSKHAFGTKDGIESAKKAGTIDSYDVLFLSNGETGWIDKTGKTVISTPRTQKEYTLNGTDLGAIKDGTTIPAGKSLDEIIAMATQKPIPATYKKPTIGITNNGGQATGAVEAGTSITPKLRATFVKNDAGDLSTISIKKGSVSVIDGNTPTLDYNGEAMVVGDEVVSFTATATYAEGPIKNNNLGDASPEGHILAGNINSSAYSIAGQRNLFFGTGVGDLPILTTENVRALSGKKLNPTQGYSWNISVAIGQQYVIFAYPAILRDVNQVMYVETNDTGCAGNFTKKLVDIADARGAANGLKSYKVYSYHMAAPAAAPMTFKVTI